MIRISFDVGGVITKYPSEFVAIIDALQKSKIIEVFILTDMDYQATKKILIKCGLKFKLQNILNADWEKYGERCKKVLIEKHNIHVHFDDLPSYCQSSAISLFVWPNNDIPFNTLEEKPNDKS